MDENMEKMNVKEKKGISPVWILPLVAVCIGGWLLFKGVRDAGVDIVVYFDDATGITQGKTQVIYKGIPVGLVHQIEVDPSLDKIAAHIEMVKETEDKLVEDVKFWIVKPEVSADKIAGLDTLVAGSYIGVLPGRSAKKTRVFTALQETPPLPVDTPGLRLHLDSPDSGDISIGNPVYYKKIKVGEVTSVKLQKEQKRVDITILIYEKYQDLVNNSTVFWNMSGVDINASLNRVQLRLGTLSTLLTGGIAFDTRADGEDLETEKIFRLHDDMHSARLSRGNKITLRLSESESVSEGTLIKFRNVEVGEVVRVEWNDAYTAFTAEALVLKKAEKLFKDNSYIWLIAPQISLNGVKNISSAIRGAHLAVEPGGGKLARYFDVHTNAPIVKEYKNGLTIVIEAARPDSLSVDAPVYYRKIKVGTILHMELAPDSQSVRMYVGIDNYYAPLIREKTVFWNASGVRVNGGLLKDIKISTESLEALMTGGISLAVPEADYGAAVESGHVFQLQPEEQASYRQWRPKIWLGSPDATIPEPAVDSENKNAL